jgi:hypothetical protein
MATKAPVNFVMSVSITVVPNGQISIKFGTGNFYGNLSRISKFDSIWKKNQVLCVETYVYFMMCVTLNHHNSILFVKWY